MKRRKAQEKENNLAVAYVRVSTKEQQEEGYSPIAQRKELMAYAEEKGIRVLKVFEDNETAKTYGRTQFNQMVHYLKGNRDCRAILVEKTDRLYRNLKDCVTIDDLKVAIHLVKEGEVISEKSRSEKKFIHTIHVAIAKRFSDNLSEEVKKGMTQKALEGYWPSYAPLGYRNTGDGKKRIIAPDPVMGPLVTKLFEEYSTGEVSVTALSEMASKAGLTHTRKGRKVPLARSAIHTLLKNRIYYGDFIWDGELYEGKHEPLISKELWCKVQEVLEGKNSAKEKRKSHNFAFSRLLKCGHCGCSMTGEMKKGKYVYYHCTGYRGNCGEPYVREKVIGEQFAEFLKNLEFDEEILEYLKKNFEAVDRKKNSYRVKEHERLKKKLSECKAKKEQIYQDKLDGLIDVVLFKKMMEKNTVEMEEISREIQILKSEEEIPFEKRISILELIRNTRTMYLKRSSSEKGRLVSNLLSNCTWKDGELTAEFRQPYDIVADAKMKHDKKKAAGESPDSLYPVWYARQDSNL